MEIMKLIPMGKDYLWGGTRLREEYGKKIDLTPLAETWECSVHRDGPSYVANGTYKGKTLAEVLKAHPEYLGTKIEDGELPVLVTASGSKSMTAKSQNWKQNGKTYRLLQTLIRFWMCTVSIENWKKSPAR